MKYLLNFSFTYRDAGTPCLRRVRIYLCMFLSQAISFPPYLGIKWDLFLHVTLVKEVPLATCSDVEPLYPAVPPLRSGHVHWGKIGPFPGRIARDPPSLAISNAPWVWEPSAPRGKSMRCIFVELFEYLFTSCIYLFICVCTCRRLYLSRHHSESSGISPDAFA